MSPVLSPFGVIPTSVVVRNHVAQRSCNCRTWKPHFSVGRETSMMLRITAAPLLRAPGGFGAYVGFVGVGTGALC
jgi:hypothetical protein